jgi:predicted PurR-regulated permease PerM
MTNWQRWSIGCGAMVFAILIYVLAPTLTPFMIAGFFAYLGNPMVNRLVRWHLPRTLAVILVFVFMILIILLLMVMLVPLIQNQVVLLFDKAPAIIEWLQNSVLPWLRSHLDVDFTLNATTVKNTLIGHWQEAGNVADKVVSTVSKSSIAILTLAINIILVPVVTFYLLRDWPLLVNKVAELIPRQIYPTIRELVSECNEVIGAFFRGQLLVMLALGIIYTAGLSIIGLDLALLIGIIIAILSIVPYLGTVIGLLTAVLATLFQFHDGIHVIYVVVLFIIGHILEGMVLTPLLVGDRIGLHPVAVIFAILAGGQLFGFLGVLLALPVAAVVMVWVRYLHRHYLNSQLYQQ